MRTYWTTENLKDEYGRPYESRRQVPMKDAILVGSLDSVQPQNHGWAEGKTIHLPCLDIDYESALIESSTPGHFHLYLNKKVTWRKYRKVLKAMAKAGLIEWGYYKASRHRHQTMLRKPGVTKQGTPLPAGKRRDYAVMGRLWHRG